MTGTHSTHIPETAEGTIYQNIERSDSLPGDHRGGNFSRQKENDQLKGTHKVEITEGRNVSGHRKKATGHGILTKLTILCYCNRDGCSMYVSSSSGEEKTKAMFSKRMRTCEGGLRR